MKKHSLVTNLKNPNLGIGYVAKCGKTKSDVIFGYCRDLLTVKNENLSEVDLSGAKKITVDDLKKYPVLSLDKFE